MVLAGQDLRFAEPCTKQRLGTELYRWNFVSRLISVNARDQIHGKEAGLLDDFARFVTYESRFGRMSNMMKNFRY